MKILLVNGSSHANGCTYTALSECGKAATEMGAEIEIFQLGSEPVRGCVDCGACFKISKCIFDDDVCNDLIAKMTEADGIIIGSPVYYAGPNGALCSILDRAFFAGSRDFANKPAAAIVCCRRGGASAAFDRLNKYFTISQMPIVSSQYWNAVHGTTPDEVRKDLEGMQVMRVLGRNMVHMINSLQTSAIPLPERERRVATNFSHGK